MPNWTPQNWNEYINRAAKNRGQEKSPEPQRTVCDEPLAETPGENRNSRRIAVSITAFRQRLLDPDNLCPKYFIDGLRYAGLLPDDNSEAITLSVSQKRCLAKEEERTEITLSKSNE